MQEFLWDLILILLLIQDSIFPNNKLPETLIGKDLVLMKDKLNGSIEKDFIYIKNNPLDIWLKLAINW